MMRSTRCFTLAATSLLATLCGTAQALPPIMDRVPAGAPLVIVLPNIEATEKDVNSVMQLVGAPGAGTMKLSDMLDGMGMSGLSTKGGIAMVMLDLPNMETGEEPRMVILAQTDDYAALAKGLSATKEGEIEKAVVNGEDVFMKSLGGGYVVAGPNADVVTKFEGKTGTGDAHKKFYGSSADKVTDKADVAVFVDMVKVKPMLDMGFDMMEQQMADMAAVTGQDGNIEQVKWLKDQIIGNMAGGVFTVSIDGSGIAFDMAGTAKEGSALAKGMAGSADSSALLKKLPAGPYLFALAADTSSKAWKEFAATMPKAKNPGVPGFDTIMGSSEKMTELTTGSGMVFAVPPGGLMSGLMTRATMFMATKEPAKLTALLSEDVAKGIKESNVGSMTFTPAAAEVDGKKVDAFEMTITPDEGVPGMGQALMFMFGQTGGPQGYMAQVDGGVVMTMSKSSEMMSAAMKAAGGESSLGNDKVIAAVSEKLPKNRSMEGYIGVKGIIDTMLPLAAMMGGKPIKVDISEKLPPVAMGFATQETQMHGTFFIPADVLKAGGDIAKAFMAAQMEGEPADDGMGAPKDEKKDAPKF